MSDSINGVEHSFLGEELRTMTRTHTIILDPPVQVSANRTLSELVLKEPTLKQLIAADGHLRSALGGVTVQQIRVRDLHLLAAVAGITVAEAESLPARVGIEAAAFFGPLQRLGVGAG